MDKLTSDGYRLNVGIVLLNSSRQVFWACRSDESNEAARWQFPQGGIHVGEAPLDALYRELHEEVGLAPQQVRILATAREWLTYDIPLAFQRSDRPSIRGQKQQWFLLQLLVDDSAIDLSTSADPEFSKWRWVSYWQPLQNIIYFKQEVYRAVLTEFFVVSVGL